MAQVYKTDELLTTYTASDFMYLTTYLLKVQVQVHQVQLHKTIITVLSWQVRKMRLLLQSRSTKLKTTVIQTHLQTLYVVCTYMDVKFYAHKHWCQPSTTLLNTTHRLLGELCQACPSAYLTVG